MAIFKSVEEIVERAGGSMKVAVTLHTNQMNIITWERQGIPVKYWRYFHDKHEVPLDDLLLIWEKARANRNQF